MNDSARHHARVQWTNRACGACDGDKKTIDYFERVEHDRNTQQPWMDTYFEFETYSGQRVLEIGVGQGTDAAQFARAGAIYHGIDIMENHLALTARNLELQRSMR